jgi:hypothetical protein
MLTTLPFVLYIATTMLLFGMACFAWGFLKGRGYETIEIAFSKDKKN